MKLALPLCALALLLTPLAASAQRKGMGPSAIEAARLKKYPPPNYLSHYLPDDRYKIKGKVWKFVSTDLDTYYHLPSSPNMLRQPASRVIGFASAKDAEEAGYVADPTDGTASVAAASLAPKMDGMDTGGMGFGGSNASEQAYLTRIIPILKQSQRDEAAWGAQLRNSSTGGAKSLSQGLGAALPYLRRIDSQLKTIRAPRRYARFHSLLVLSNRQAITALGQMSRNTGQGGFSMSGVNLTSVIATQQQLVAEAQKVGIDPQLLR